MTATASHAQVIPANEYRRERWRNQSGWTREIARACPCRVAGGPASRCSGACEGFAYRLSIAEIEQDGPFSVFPGIERELVLLSGNGLRLRFDDGQVAVLEPPHDRLRFDGARAVACELLDGPTHDFNLMWRRDLLDVQLWHRPLVGPMVVFGEPASTWAVYLIAGQARFADDSGLPGLAAGDTAILEAGTSRMRHVLDGAGEALVIRLQPCDVERVAGSVA